MGTLPHPILDFTWSSLNKVTARKASEKVMNFRGTLHRITRKVLTADPWLVLVYLGKVDLSKAYMRIWVRIEDTSSVDFLLPKKMPQENQLVGFHSSLPLGFVDSMSYFCMEIDMDTDITNAPMECHHTEPITPLEEAAVHIGTIILTPHANGR